MPGYDTAGDNSAFHYGWAQSTGNAVYRNCHTNKRITEVLGESPIGECGDCAVPSPHCSGIPTQSLTPERNTPIQLTLTPKDKFGGATELPAGAIFIVTLTSVDALNVTVQIGDVPAASGDGTYVSSITPNSAGNFSLSIKVQLIDPANPLTTINTPIFGSPFAVEAQEPICPRNARVDINAAEMGCQCSPGYTSVTSTAAGSKYQTEEGAAVDGLQCSACNIGQFKDKIGSQACSTCQPGKAAEQKSATKCVYCAAGKDVPDGAFLCKQCDPGRFRKAQVDTGENSPLANSDLLTKCQPCAEGFVSITKGASICTSCPGGMERSQVATPAGCIACVAGRHREPQSNLDPETDTPTSCTDCATGTSAPLDGLSNCTACASGRSAANVATVTCAACAQGTFASEIGTVACSTCPGGYFASATESTRCNGCGAGMFSAVEGGAQACTTCKRNPDTRYAASLSIKCSGCVSPLQIRTGSEASSVNDCACPEGTYLSSGTIAVSPVCANCPDGGICPQGTGNVTDVAAKLGYWRPTPTVDKFWKCPVSVTTGNGLKWRNWMTCYGGTQSQCAPVFDWRSGKVKSGGKEQRVQAALNDQSSSVPVSILNPTDFSSHLNTTGINEIFNGVTLANAIASYITYIHSGTESFISNDGPFETLSNLTRVGQRTKAVAEKDFLEFFGAAEGLWIDGEFISKEDIQQFADRKMVVGWMTGPLCAICPSGTGRQGDFKSDSPCEPCPTDSSTNNLIVLGLFVAILGMVVLFVYSQIKKGAHELHLEQEHIREHNATKAEEVEDDENDGRDSSVTGSNSLMSDVDSTPSMSNPMNNKKNARKNRRGSTRVYKHAKTKFSKDRTLKSLQEHQHLQRENGT